jgi:hypothetical protein
VLIEEKINNSEKRANFFENALLARGKGETSGKSPNENQFLG